MRETFTSATARIMVASVLGGLLCAAPSIAQADTQFKLQMRLLIDQQARLSDAYKYAIETESAKNDDEYELWLGTAAIGVWRIDEAIKTLNSFISKHPGHVQLPRAQLELGKAYLMVGDINRAKHQFKLVRDTNPPQQVERNIQSLLESAKLTGDESKFSSQGAISVGFGHDTNANGGVSNSLIFLPTLGLITIDSSGLKKRSDFSLVEGNVNLGYQLDSNFSVIAMGKAESRYYAGNSDLDLLNLNFSTGLAWVSGRQQARVLIGSDTLSIGNTKYRDQDSVTAYTQFNVTDVDTFSVGVSTSNISYAGDNISRDARANMTTLGYQHKFNKPWSPTFFASLATGQENNVRNLPHLGRDFNVQRVGIALKPSAKWTVTASYMSQASTYQAADLLLDMRRKDDLTAIDLAVDYEINKKTALVINHSSMKNSSNASLWNFDRDITAIKIRYNF